jgi:hypothetical protein
MKHTPGRWTWCEVGDTGGDNPMPVCEVTAGDYQRVAEHLTLPDAMLVAAAPEMLAVLSLLVHGDGKPDEMPRIMTAARAAIAKAEGR